MNGITKRDVILIIIAVVIAELVRRFVTMAARQQKRTRGVPPASMPSAFPAEVGPGLTGDDNADFIALDQLDMADIGNEMQR